MTAAAVWLLSAACAALVFVDALRRPQSTWFAADRDRGWWLATVGVMGVFGLGPLGLLAYAIGVLPRLGGDSRQRVDDAFRKDRLR